MEQAIGRLRFLERRAKRLRAWCGGVTSVFEGSEFSEDRRRWRVRHNRLTRVIENPVGHSEHVGSCGLLSSMQSVDELPRPHHEVCAPDRVQVSDDELPFDPDPLTHPELKAAEVH